MGMSNIFIGGFYMEEMIVKNVDVMGDFIIAAKFKNKA